MIGYLLRENPQEIYRIEITEDSFLFSFKEALYTFLLEEVTRLEFRKTDFETIEVTEGIATLRVTLPFIPLPNYSHKKIEWEKLSECAEQIHLLLWLLNMTLSEKSVPEFFLSENPQLMLIETSYSKNHDFHGHAINVGFSPNICEMLAKKYVEGERIRKCEETSFRFYFGLSSKTKKEYEDAKKMHLKYGGNFNSIVASIRPGGTPHFIVPGNCACLGANPDEFVYDNEISSHNLDTSLQQMAMLSSLVSFWNEVLKPLHKMNK